MIRKLQFKATFAQLSFIYRLASTRSEDHIHFLVHQYFLRP